MPGAENANALPHAVRISILRAQSAMLHTHALMPPIEQARLRHGKPSMVAILEEPTGAYQG